MIGQFRHSFVKGFCADLSLVSFQHSDGVWLDLRFRSTFLPSPPNQQYNKDDEYNRTDNHWNNPPFDRRRSNSWRQFRGSCWHESLSWRGKNLQNRCLRSDLQLGLKYKAVVIAFLHRNCKVDWSESTFVYKMSFDMQNYTEFQRNRTTLHKDSKTPKR